MFSPVDDFEKQLVNLPLIQKNKSAQVQRARSQSASHFSPESLSTILTEAISLCIKGEKLHLYNLKWEIMFVCV